MVRSNVYNPSLTIRTEWAWEEKRYLVASEPGSLATFHFFSPPPTHNASVAIAYQRSATYGLGKVRCRVDSGPWKLVDGYWDIRERNMGMVTQISSDLSDGPHTLSCELLGQTSDPGGGQEFRLISVMHD